MDQLLPTLPPEHLLETKMAESTGTDEANLLYSERETEKRGGAPLPDAPVEEISLRPELLAQLAHVRGMLAEEFAAIAEGEACLTCSFQA